MNGSNLMKELRKLAQEGKLDPEEGTRAILAALADVIDNQHEQDEKQTICNEDVLTKMDRQEKRLEEGISKQTTKIDLRFKEVLASQVDQKKYVKNNPMFKLGLFIYHNKKITWFLIAVAFILSNIWFVPEFRVGIAMLLVPLGFPSEWVDFLSGN